jgi:hypothetical protein
VDSNLAALEAAKLYAEQGDVRRAIAELERKTKASNTSSSSTQELQKMALLLGKLRERTGQCATEELVAYYSQIVKRSQDAEYVPSSMWWRLTCDSHSPTIALQCRLTLDVIETPTWLKRASLQSVNTTTNYCTQHKTAAARTRRYNTARRCIAAARSVGRTRRHRLFQPTFPTSSSTMPALCNGAPSTSITRCRAC